MNEINSGKLLKSGNSNNKVINLEKNFSLKDYISLKMPNIKLNKNNKTSIISKNKIDSNVKNYHTDSINRTKIELKNNNIHMKNSSNSTINTNSKKPFSQLNNEIMFNIGINYFLKENFNILKYLNYKNLISRHDKIISNKENQGIIEYKLFINDNEKRHESALRQRNAKNLDSYLIVNNLKFTESETKNIFKSKSDLNSNISHKLLLPKMEQNPKKILINNNKKIKQINEHLTYSSNNINTLLSQRNTKKIIIPKIILRKGNNNNNCIQSKKESKTIKASISLKIESASLPGTNYNTKKMNQDSFFIMPNIKHINKLNNFFIQIFGIFDGHGDHGHIISKEIKEYFIDYFNTLNLDMISNNNNAIYEKLVKNNYEEIYNLFKNIDEKLHKKYSSPENSNNICIHSGTTALIIILFYNKIISINLGHSKSIIIYKNNSILQLNSLHIPESEEEKKRIEKNGGIVKMEEWSSEGPKRICYKEDDNIKYSGLSVSRSFGDFASEQLGVFSIPEIKEFNLDYNDVKILVIATNGIWEFLSNENVRDTILNYYDEDNIEGGINKLISVGKKIWSVKNPYYIDDLTAILTFFIK